MAAPQSTPLPQAPQRNEAEASFNTKATAFVSALEPFRSELQDQADFINAVFVNIPDIDTVAGISADISAVAAASANVETVAGNVSSINTVAGSIGDVNAVAGSESSVTAAADNIADINAVAGSVADINTVSGITGDVSAVADVDADVAALAPYATQIPAAAGIASDLPAANALAVQQTLMARSLAQNPPADGETLRLDYANRAYGLGDAGEGLIDEIVPFSAAQTFTRGSAATAVNALGQIAEYGVDEPRYQYDPLTGKPQGLLIEEQRTNLLTDSESAFFGATAVTVTTDTISAGGVVLTKVIETTTSENRFRAVYNQSGTFTLSVFVGKEQVGAKRYIQFRAGSALISVFSPSEGVFTREETPMTVEDFGDVYRVSATLSDTNQAFVIGMVPYPAASGGSYTGDGISGLFVGGFQIEQGSTPSSYIKTEGTQVTRAAGSCIRTLGDEFNASEGTLYAEFTVMGNSAFSGIGLSNATSSERIILRHTGPSNQAQAVLTSNSVTDALASNADDLLPGQTARMAVAWGDGTFEFAFNGTSFGSRALPGGAVPQPTRLDSAGEDTVGINPTIRHNHSIRLISRKLSESELIEMTAPEA